MGQNGPKICGRGSPINRRTPVTHRYPSTHGVGRGHLPYPGIPRALPMDIPLCAGGGGTTLTTIQVDEDFTKDAKMDGVKPGVAPGYQKRQGTVKM